MTKLYGVPYFHRMRTYFHPIDPCIPVKHALAYFGGVQSHLAAALHIGRSNVNDWITDGVRWVPPLHAHRLVALAPKEFGRYARRRNR